MSAFIEVAVITKPKGIKGEVHVHVLEGFLPEVLNTNAVFAQQSGQRVPYIIEEFVAAGDRMARIKFKGIDSKEKAEVLRNFPLLVAEARAIEHSEPQDELIGYEVYNQEQLIGKLSELLSTTAQDLISVTTEGGAEVLIPFVDDFIIKQDDENKKLVLRLPEGLLDVND